VAMSEMWAFPRSLARLSIVPDRCPRASRVVDLTRPHA
jgi:hypothetical protein